MFLLTEEVVEQIHDDVLGGHELPGRAMGKSPSGALARVDNRIAYGLIGDAYDLAAAYAMAIVRGHCFNDGNKRTAFRAMHVCLLGNGIIRTWDTEEVGQKIIALAQALTDDGDIAEWLRDTA